MRLLAFSQIWNAFSGRYSTYRYEELHQQQLLNWGIEERGRYSSYRGMLSVSAPSSHQTSSCVRVSSDVLFFFKQVPASWASGWLLKNIGTKRSLFVGNISVMCEQLCAAMARTGWHCKRPFPRSGRLFPQSCSKEAAGGLQFMRSGRCGSRVAWPSWR